MAKQIFVNLPVKDLNRSMEFFGQLGFSFNPQFTNEQAACMVISKEIYAMLLVEDMFKTFIKKDICNSSKSTEVILCLSVESREQVDEMVEKALAAGAQSPKAPQDHGWMYYRDFEDLDGHHWEIMFADENALSQQAQSAETAQA